MKNMHWFDSLKVKSILLLIIIPMLCISASTLISYQLMHEQMISDYNNNKETIVESLSISLPPMLELYDYTLVERTIKSTMISDSVAYVAVHDKNGKLIRGGINENIPKEDLDVINRDIMSNGELIGRFEIGFSKVYVYEYMRRTTIALISGLMGFFILIGVALYILVSRHIVEPLETFTKTIEGYGQGNLPNLVNIHRNDEIGTLAASFNDLIEKLNKNINERTKAEKTLLESENRFRTIFNSLSDAIFIQSIENGAIIDVNNKMCEMTGYTHDEACRASLDDLGSGEPPYTKQDALKWIQKAATDGPQLFEWIAKTKSGSLFWSEVNIHRVNISGIDRLLVSVRDIVQRKRTEEELQRHRDHLEELVKERTQSLAKRTDELNKANIKLKELDKLKSMFIASMSHELRTPLNSIIGFTGMTLQGLSGQLNEEQMDNLTRVNRSAEHLLSLITDIIDISKIEAGRVEVFIEPFTLSEIISEAVSTIQPQVKQKGLVLETDVPVDIKMKTDRKRLMQCIINYISNAVKFTEVGKVRVLAKDADGDVEISVIDTGIGISEKDMPRLFEAFERIDTHLRVKAGGSGLGLYLTKKMATELLHGSVGVESIEGKGSTFSIRIPKMLKKEGEMK